MAILKGGTRVYGNLIVDGSFIGNAGISSVKVTSYTTASSGTFTRNANTIIAQVIVTGGGGGGGGADSDGASASTAGGGGGGGTAIKWLTASQLGATASYTVGGGGAGATSGSNGGNGSTGSNSTFTCTGTGTIVLTGSGGGGGTGSGDAYGNDTSAFAGGAGGGATNGDINHTGVDGKPGFGALNGNYSTIAGNGGASYWGGGQANSLPTSNTTNASQGANATVSGAGGSGSRNAFTTTAVAGGSGAAGAILVVEYIKQ